MKPIDSEFFELRFSRLRYAFGKTFFSINDPGPINLNLIDINAKLRSLTDFIEYFGATDQYFFRIAAVKRTKSPNRAMVNNGCFESGLLNFKSGR